MSDATDNKLEQVYGLIRQEKLDEAVSILQPVLLNEPENADAWWLWANTVTEPEDARQALQKVMQYNPAHQAAREMLNQLNDLYPPVPEAETSDFGLGEDADFDNLYGDTDFQQVLDPDIPSVLPPDVEDVEIEESQAEPEIAPIRQLNFAAEESVPTEGTGAVDLGSLFDDEFDDDLLLDEEEGEKKQRPILRTLLIVLLIFAVGMVVILLLGLFSGNNAAPVAEQSQPPEAVQSIMPGLEAAANAEAELLGGPSTISYSAVGEPGITLLVCRTVGPDLSSAMDAAMELVITESAALQNNEVGLFSVQLMNCDRDDVLLIASAPVSDAQAYLNSDITWTEFRATWQWQ